MPGDTPLQPDSEAVASPRSRRRFQPAHEVRARRRRLVAWSLFAASAMLLVNALFGENGYLATLRAEREYRAAADSLAGIRDENRRLRHDIDRLRHDPTALEELARGRHGLIKPGETLVIVKEPPPAVAPGRD